VGVHAAGYEKQKSARYPVLYLLHGSGDVAASWTQAGKANLILDNLIAAEEGEPDDHRDAVAQRREPLELESTIRRVIREEHRRAG
jgi:enterochelin esterase-like enzyme